jgi:regulator of telomere elongation helicase 1
MINRSEFCLNFAFKFKLRRYNVGPSGKRLNSSYRFRDTDEYKVELGQLIVNFSRIIPDGLLVFFPSYGQGLTLVHSSAQRKRFLWDRWCI